MLSGHLKNWTSGTGEIKQLIFLCALHLPVIYTTHLLPHWAEVGLVFEDYLTSLHWYQMSLTAANQDRGIVKKGCAEKDTAFRPFSYSSATIHVHYTVFKKVKPEVSYLQEMPIVILSLHYWCPCPIAQNPPPQSNKHKHRKISWCTLFLKEPCHEMLTRRAHIYIYVYVCINTHIYTCINTHICVYVCVYIHTYIIYLVLCLNVWYKILYTTMYLFIRTQWSPLLYMSSAATALLQVVHALKGLGHILHSYSYVHCNNRNIPSHYKKIIL